MSNRYDDWENEDNRYNREDRSHRSDRDRSRDDWNSADTRNRNRDDDAIRRSRTAGMLSRDYGGYGTGSAGSRAGYSGGYDDYSSVDFDRRDRDLTYGRYGRDAEQNRDRYDAGRYTPRRNTSERGLEPYRGSSDPNDSSSHSNYTETPARRTRAEYERNFNAEAGRNSGRDYDRGNDRSNDRGFWDRASDEVASWFGDEDAEHRRRQDARHQGSHAGRGPRGYRRSDERIREDVNDRLTDHAYLDATDVDVSVSDGTVTLSGTVDSRNAKRLAEDLAESVSGVRDVDNNLRVNRQNDVASSTSPATATSNASSATMNTSDPTGAVSTSTPTSSSTSSATSK